MPRKILIAAPLAGMLAIHVAAAAEGIDEARIYSENKNRIVKIVTSITDPARGTGPPEVGTGIMISPVGHVLTAAHVIGGAKKIDGRKISITMLDDAGRPVPLAVEPFVESVDPKLDLAVLQLTGQYSYAEVSMTQISGSPPLTAIIWNAGDNVPRPYSGTLNVSDQALLGDRLVLELAVIPSNSGAAVFDATGVVVGIMTNKKSEHDGRFSLAAPLSSVASEFFPVLSPRERQVCIDRRRAELTKPQSMQEQVVEIMCEGSAGLRSNGAMLTAPAGYTITGFPSHDDSIEGHGWVGAMEYTAEDSGRVSEVAVEVHCKTAGSFAKGYAKTVLRGSVRKILTDADQTEIQLKCITRR